MLVIGIVGGVAAGKSFVAERLHELGAEVVNADRLGHEVLGEPEVKDALRRRWGEDVFGPDGEVDRSRLAKIVFAPPPEGPRQRAHLEQITHPRIEHRLRRRLAGLGDRPDLKAVVLDAPVLLEAGWARYCDKIVFVDAPRDVRRARAAARGWTEADFAAREAAQESLHQKRGCADVLIDNSGAPTATQDQIDRFWRSLD